MKEEKIKGRKEGRKVERKSNQYTLKSVAHGRKSTHTWYRYVRAPLITNYVKLQKAHSCKFGGASIASPETRREKNKSAGLQASG